MHRLLLFLRSLDDAHGHASAIGKGDGFRDELAEAEFGWALPFFDEYEDRRPGIDTHLRVF